MCKRSRDLSYSKMIDHMHKDAMKARYSLKRFEKSKNENQPEERKLREDRFA